MLFCMVIVSVFDVSVSIFTAVDEFRTNNFSVESESNIVTADMRHDANGQRTGQNRIEV